MRPRIRRGPPRPRLLLVTLWLLATAAAAQPNADDAEAALALVPDAGTFVRDGALLYDYHCSACHGDTGRGLAEARAAFPETHRVCTRCHRDHNPPQMEAGAMTPRNAFDVGVAPPLLGSDTALAAFPDAGALYRYLRATMPRPYPGALEDRDYLRITAFLAQASGAHVPSGPLTKERAADVSLR